MFIKSMVLDGFKSYGHRVEINGFDREFNAITGLNGTGKSNILDGICFVLGISNLSHVRASNLQDLVYKSGQAGIMRASVSITFDNTDKERCPAGYENHKEITITRQVVMGGKNKYLVNGVNFQNRRVADLFCSVQLNVNNPTFLIMQGRILKILNMKPVDILGMIEEAAGTKMYETKRITAQNTIEKKDAKLKELNEIISENIAPKLRKLQDERSQYQEFQKVIRELDNLTKLHVAWVFVKTEENEEGVKKKIEDIKIEVQQKKGKITENEKEAKNIAKLVTEMHQKLDAESGGELKGLEKEAQEKEKIVTGLQHTTDNSLQSLKDHKKDHVRLNSQVSGDETALAQKIKQFEDAEAKWGSIRDACEKDSAALEAAQARLMSAKTRDAAVDGAGASASLEEQLTAAQKAVFEASTDMTRCLNEKKSFEDTIKAKQKEFSSNSEQFNRDQANITSMEKEVKKIENELERLNYDEDSVSELTSSARQLNSSVCGLRDKVHRLGSKLHQCNIQYSDPEPNFNRARVHGTVSRLISVNDPVYCTALETVAGGRLYNVVVDTDATGKLLLQKGQLQKRITLIPLNKIHGNVIDRQTVEFAKQLVGHDNVQLALSLIKYENKVKAAMEWVFGQTLICKDLNVARIVTYHPRIMKRCVTIDGEVVDPQGTLSGGAKNTGPSVLYSLNELKAVESELGLREAELEQVNGQLKSIQNVAEKYSTLKRKYNLMSTELKSVKESMQKNRHFNLHEELEQLKAKVKELNHTIDQSKKLHDEKMKLQKDLEVKVKDVKGYRERELKKAEEDVQKMKKQAENSRNKWSKMEKDFSTLEGEVSELKNNIESGRQQAAEGDKTLKEMEKQHKEHEAALNKAKNHLKAAQAELKAKKSEIATQNHEISKTLQRKEQILSSNTDIGLKIQELEHKVTTMQAEALEFTRKMDSLLKEHNWIPSERRFFGVAGGLYDFKARDPTSAGQMMAQLNERKEKLARGGVNARAHTLLGKEEEQYNDVMKKKLIVEQDRAKLVQVIKELDEKKKQALLQACERVNKDFGSIFSTLLPQAQAKLIPPAGKTVLDGLEVKVGFNNTWKDSVGELSGGQKSLVALSLVLAMLLFKPAPLYILDEVDSALDLSHTQNIGMMLKNHFKDSQFIIVSLKDGMFANANVLFRTRFVDGMSSVQRTASTRRT